MYKLNSLAFSGTVAVALLGTTLVTETVSAQETPTATTAPAKELPDAMDIVGKALKALGGRKAMTDIKTMSFKVTAVPVMGGGEQTELLVQTAPGRKVIAEIAMPTGSVKVGQSGDVGWMVQGDTYTVMPKEQLGQFALMNQFAGLLRLTSPDATFKALELKDVGGRECCKLETTLKDGTKHVGYFATDDGTAMAAEAPQDTPMGPMVMMVEYKNPAPVGDLKLFSSASVTVPGMGQIVSLLYADVKINSVELSAFDVPEQIKSQMNAEPATTQPTGAAGG